MDFIERLKALSAQAEKQLEHIQTEEATKTALVMPFLSALGYNVFDPTEVVPEFTADVGVKKGEKVDYAVLKDGKVIILIECKWSGDELTPEHASQLYRYFSVTEARFGVLTNGIEYRFFTDLEDPNRMDSRPFLEFDFLDFNEALVGELKKFTKTRFDIDSIVTTASELKYTSEIKKLITSEVSDPSEGFVRFFAKQVYPGIMTQAVREAFTGFTKRAFQHYISDRISDRLKIALADVAEEPDQVIETQEAVPDEKPSGIETTEEETEAFYIVKAILRETIDPARIAIRDTKSYCSVLLDDNNRKPICRLRFDRTQKYMGLIDAEKKEERVPINDFNEIYDLADRLKQTALGYDQ